MGSFFKITVLVVSYVTLAAAASIEQTTTNTTDGPPPEGHHGRPRPLVSKECTFCICKDRGCKNENTTCDSSIANMYSAGCGLFQMSLGYWIDGGNQSVTGEIASNETAYESCAKDYKCAAKTIENYMRRYKKDCNDDGIIDCADMAAIHRAGAGACNETAGQESAKNVTECLKTQGGCGGGPGPRQGPHGPRPESGPKQGPHGPRPESGPNQGPHGPRPEGPSTGKAKTEVDIEIAGAEGDSEMKIKITGSEEGSESNEDADSKSESD